MPSLVDIIYALFVWVQMLDIRHMPSFLDIIYALFFWVQMLDIRHIYSFIFWVQMLDRLICFLFLGSDVRY